MSKPKSFEQAIADIQQSAPEPSKPPFAWYNPDGDTLEIYLEAGPRVAERFDDLLTLFVSAEDRERVVGIAIKRIRAHFGAAGLTGVFLKTGRAHVAGLLMQAHAAREFSLVREGPDAVARVLSADRLERLMDLTRLVKDVEFEVPEALVG